MQLIYDNAHRDTRKQHKLLQLFFFIMNCNIIITYLLQIYDNAHRDRHRKKLLVVLLLIFNTKITRRHTHTHARTSTQIESYSIVSID